MRLLLFLLTCQFLSCSEGPKNIIIKGSDTEVNLAVLLAEDFHKQNKLPVISISGGGSGLGIASLLNGTADIANSSRKVNAHEERLFKEKGLMLKSFIFAQDAIAFVVSDKLPLDSIDTRQLGKVLDGTYTNWTSLSDKDLPINIYGRQSNSGTHEFVRAILNIKFSPHANQMNGNAQILEAIKEDYSGIGYVGAGYVTTGNVSGVKVLKIFTEKGHPAISPFDTEKIASGDYLFQRPLFQYYLARDEERLTPFFQFEVSVKGLQIIQSTGYYPVMHEEQ